MSRGAIHTYTGGADRTGSLPKHVSWGFSRRPMLRSAAVESWCSSPSTPRQQLTWYDIVRVKFSPDSPGVKRGFRFARSSCTCASQAVKLYTSMLRGTVAALPAADALPPSSVTALSVLPFPLAGCTACASKGAVDPRMRCSQSRLALSSPVQANHISRCADTHTTYATCHHHQAVGRRSRLCIIAKQHTQGPFNMRHAQQQHAKPTCGGCLELHAPRCAAQLAPVETLTAAPGAQKRRIHCTAPTPAAR